MTKIGASLFFPVFPCHNSVGPFLKGPFNGVFHINLLKVRIKPSAGRCDVIGSYALSKQKAFGKLDTLMVSLMFHTLLYKKDFCYQVSFVAISFDSIKSVTTNRIQVVHFSQM